MARSHLTLAALATSALPGLDVARARKHSHGAHGLFDSALVIDQGGRELIIRVPLTQAAETEQSADLIALRALTTGNRSRLPFDVPEFLGQAPIDGTRAVVYGLLPGDSFSADALTSHSGVAGSIGRAIAAIHGLPTAFVATAGLGQQSAQECHTSTIALIDRTAATGHLPAALLRRWEQATDNNALWQFAPTVIHGTLSAESFLIGDDSVTAVLGWSGLCVGDPAHDLHWLLATRGAASESAIAAYTAARQNNDPNLFQRSLLYSELELARWLLHGIDTHDQSIVNDAILMLDNLVESVHSHTMDPLSPPTGPVLGIHDVENLLETTPRQTPEALAGAQYISQQTDAYDLSGLRSGDFDDETEAGSEAGSEPAAEDFVAGDFVAEVSPGASAAALEDPAADPAHGDEDQTGPIDLVKIPGATPLW